MVGGHPKDGDRPSMALHLVLIFLNFVSVPNLKSVVHFLLIDFAGGSSSSCSSCDRGKTKSTPSQKT